MPDTVPRVLENSPEQGEQDGRIPVVKGLILQWKEMDVKRETDENGI